MLKSGCSPKGGGRVFSKNKVKMKEKANRKSIYLFVFDQTVHHSFLCTRTRCMIAVNVIVYPTVQNSTLIRTRRDMISPVDS